MFDGIYAARARKIPRSARKKSRTHGWRKTLSGERVLDARDLQQALLARAASLRRYVEARIPRRFQAVLSPDDVLQDTWIAAFQNWSSDVEDLGRWLTSLANSKLVDALREARCLKRGGDRTFIGEASKRRTSFEALFDRLRTPYRSPSRDASAEEARAALCIALASLPSDVQEVVRLRFIEGQSRKEIARITNRTETAVGGVLFRAMKELRADLGEAVKFFSDAEPSIDGS